MKKYLLVFLMMFGLGCQSSTATTGSEADAAAAFAIGRPASPEEIRALAEDMQYGAGALPLAQGLPQAREGRYEPAAFLDGLVSGLRAASPPVRSVTGYVYANLRRISETTTALAGSLLGPKEDQGFLMMSADFWKSAAALEKRGFRVGVILSASEKISGMYVPGGKPLILVDEAASSSTLAHEYRHHLQHERSRDWRWYEDRVIPEGCYDALNSYLGEVDSTQIQVPRWRETLESLSLAAADEAAKAGRRPYPDLAIVSMLNANLDYPRFAAGWVKDRADCSPALRDFARGFESFQEYEAELYYEKHLSELAKAYAAYTGALIYRPDDSVSRASAAAAFETAKMEASAALGLYAERREEEMRSLLKTLDGESPEEYAELKRHSGAFQYLADPSYEYSVEIR